MIEHGHCMGCGKVTLTKQYCKPCLKDKFGKERGYDYKK